MWTHDLAVLGMVTVETHSLKSLGPSVSTQPAIHACSAFANLLAMLGTRSAPNMVDSQKHWPTLAATSTGFAVVPKGLEFYV